MARVLVTGATGFIGPHLVRFLHDQGDEVRCTRRHSVETKSLQDVNVQWVQADVTQPDSLAAIVRDVDVVYHLAGVIMALKQETFFRVNVEGTRNLMRACAACPTPPKVVMVSSLAAAGPQMGDELRREEQLSHPVSNYGRSKRQAEIAALEFAGQTPLSIVRPPIVFGEGDKQFLEMVRPIARFGVHLTPGYRRKRFSLIHVADLCTGIVAAARHGQRAAPWTGEENGNAGLYYFSHDEHPSYGDLGRMIARTLNRKVWVIPTALAATWIAAGASELAGRVMRKPRIFNLDKAREASAGSWTCSSERARRELGWAPSADLAARMAQTTDWYREQGWL